MHRYIEAKGHTAAVVAITEVVPSAASPAHLPNGFKRKPQ
jgi:hypothetical protein